MTMTMSGSHIGLRDDLIDLDAWWRAANYLAAGQIYLMDNPLLTDSLRPEHIKPRLIGHWGTVPGVTLTYAHLNRVIARTGQEMLFVLGPGHGAAALNAATWLEGTYSLHHPEVGQNRSGMRELFRQFSFPGGVPSHAGPHLPGSIHEGGELGYSLAHATGAALDNPDLVVACMIGDGEAETGTLATSWHGSLFLDRVNDGTVLPILHLNGYKLETPTLLSRISRGELDSMLSAQGWEPMYVEGNDPVAVHERYALVLDEAMDRIREIREHARLGLGPMDPCRPMIVLRTPKGWTGPVAVDGVPIEGTYRAHQVPLESVRENPEHRALLEKWLRSYHPEELFDADGRPVERIARLHPEHLRMSANRAAHGHDSADLRLPCPADYTVGFSAPGTESAEATRVLGGYLRDTLVENPHNLLFFSPDEHSSNRLDAILEVTGKRWRSTVLPGDEHLSPDGRVFEVLSEQLCQGWLEGYLLTGRHGVFSTYEAFAHIIDSMVVQHAKWLRMAAEFPWREPIPSLNYLITSHVWRQDHNGASHQDPGFIDHVLSKRPEVSRVYLPPDANCLLHVFDHCLRSRGRVNVVVAGKQPALQYLDADAARLHCERGLGVWEWASTDTDRPAEVVLACAGDVPTQETLAAAAILRDLVPDLAVRVVNVVDLARLFPPDRHPHGIPDDEYRAIFTDAPVIFAFHGYPWLIHRIAYRRPGHDVMHVHGFTDNGTTTTPFDMCAMNGIDRYELAAAAIAEVPRLADRREACTDHLMERLQYASAYARRHGEDPPEITGWRWPA